MQLVPEALGLPVSVLCTTAREKKTERRKFQYHGMDCTIQARIRYDDSCGNGHNSFAITGDICDPVGRWCAGGCLHDEIAKAFPELAGDLKWHLCSTDGPTHYIANTVYHAGDRDHRGCRRGEPRLDKEGKPILLNYPANPWSGEPARTEVLRGEGKPRELDYARSSAIWPEATDEELMGDPEVLKGKLLERLPGLMQEFKAMIERHGWVY